MPLAVTTRSIKRQAIKSIHEPPTAKDKVKVSGEMQSEKAKMVRELIPFLTYLYKKYMGARITEDMTVLQFEDIKIPISVGDTVLGGKFKNKRIVVKSIGKNEKGDITINGRPLLKYRTLEESAKRDYKKEYAKYGKSKKAKKYRAELNKYNRDKGTYGNGDGKDASHKGGKIVGFEAESKNRGRREKSRLKKESSINEACWKGYKQVGGKMKNGKMVPNCVPINEIPMPDLKKIDTFADKKLNPVDVVLTDKHFFDRLNDPRNGKEISQAELIGFFKRLGKKKKEFVEFLNQYKSLVAVDDRTNINIPFMKQANKAIAKTVMRKKDFKTPDKKLDI